MREEAFALIVEETKGIVLSAIKKNLFQEYFYAIDDVVQETYIRAYRSLIKNKFREESKLSSWLYTIARNESIRMNGRLKREEGRRQNYFEERMESICMQESNPVERKIEREELRKIVREAVEELPQKFRNVMILYIKGFDNNQISNFLSIPQGTVKSRIHRGKEKLKEILKKEKIYGNI